MYRTFTTPNDLLITPGTTLSSLEISEDDHRAIKSAVKRMQLKATSHITTNQPVKSNDSNTPVERLDKSDENSSSSDDDDEETAFDKIEKTLPQKPKQSALIEWLRPSIRRAGQAGQGKGRG